MMIFVYVLIFSVLLFLGYRLKQMWYWFNTINHDTWLLNNTQTHERVLRFIMSLPKQLSNLNAVKLILNGKMFTIYEEMSSDHMVEYLDTVIVGMDKYIHDVFDPTVYNSFSQWVNLTSTTYGHFYLCLFRYLYFYKHYELRHKVDCTRLSVDLKDRASPELITYLESAGPLTPKVLVDDACCMFFTQLLTKYNEEEHGSLNVIESIIVGRLLAVDKMTVLLGPSLVEHYNNEVSNK